MDFVGGFRAGAVAVVVAAALMVGALTPMSVAMATAETDTPVAAPASAPAPAVDDDGPPVAGALPADATASTADDDDALTTATDDGALTTATDDGALTTATDDDAVSSPSTATAAQRQSTFATHTPSAVPTEPPNWRQAKIVVRAGGDWLADGSVAGLAGVQFEVHRALSETDLNSNSPVATCTTGADGRCGVIVDLPHDGSSYSGYYYAKQVSASSQGWWHTETWGSSTDYIRHNTGRLTGGTTVNLPDGARSWPNVRTNPALVAPACFDGRDLDVAFVIDLSNSINRYVTPAVFADYKEQATALVDTLAGTETMMSVYTFGTDAPAAGAANGTLSSTPVSTAAGAETVRSKIRNLTQTPYSTQGYANWDEGLAQTIGQGHDVVVLLTDGEPTAHRGNRDGAPVTLAKVEEAIHSANGVKAGGTRVAIVGVAAAHSTANHRRLAHLSSTYDYVTTSDIGRAGALLQGVATLLAEAARADCTTLTVTTRTEHADGAGPAVGWALTADLGDGGPATPWQASTGADGSATFYVGYRPASSVQRVTVTQTQQAGHTISRAGAANATCTANGTSLQVVNTDGGFAVDVPAGAAVACTITNAPVVSTYQPGPAEATVVLRAGGDRLADGSVGGVAGASFDVYRSGWPGALVDGTRVGTCTTTPDDGTCAVVVSLADATQGATFYGVQTEAPAGWTVADRWGGQSDLVRYSTGQVGGGRTAALPDGTRRWPQVRDNPELPPRCGVDVALVYDLSNSVAEPDRDYYDSFVEYKGAGAGLVDALEGTPSRVGVYTYATDGPAAGTANGNLPLTSVARPAGADTVRSKVNGLTNTPDRAEGYTNWDEALAQLPGGFDVVVFLTDGEPTAYRGNRDGYPATVAKVAGAIHSANAVKAGGAHIVVIGAGPAHDDANYQRLTLLSDDTRLSDFEGLGALLEEVALQDCAGTVNVVKDAQDVPGGELVPGEGWEFTPEAAGAGAVSGPALTDADGTASFTVDMSAHAPATRTVTLTETPREGFAIEPQEGANAVCAASDDAPVSVGDVEHGFVVEARHDAVITCRVVNAVVPHPAVTIRKAAPAVDPGGGALPWVVAGTEVTWSYTVTNTGNVPLRDLHVTDDSDVEVTCPVTAESPESGNPIAVLAVGESMTCSGTGPVTPTPSPGPGTANERKVT